MSDEEKWCDCPQAYKCVRDRCEKCCYCGTPRPVKAVALNFDEARQLAEMKQKESNLARCYLALAARLAPSPPTDVSPAIKLRSIEIAKKWVALEHQPFLARDVMELVFVAIAELVRKLGVDLPCPECGKRMTNHVVVTRHETGTCDETFTGPPLDEYLVPTKDNAFYSEHVLGVAPNGTPTPHLLRPEFRRHDEPDHPGDLASDAMMAAAWLDGPIGKDALPEARKSLAKLLTDTRAYERARLAPAKKGKR